MANFNKRIFPPVGEIVSRDAARASGSDIFFTGRACIRDHVTWRYTRTNQCVACARFHGSRKYAERMADGGETLRVAAKNWRRVNPAAYALANIKRRAKDYGLEFSLTKADLVFPENCACCGQRMEIAATEAGGPARHSPSVDRIDSAKGYTPDNIAFICYRCNTLKKDGTVEEFENIIAYMRRSGPQAVAYLSLVKKETA